MTGTIPPGATAAQRRDTAVRVVTVFALLYLFLVGVSLIGSGIGALGEGFQAGLLERISNPFAGLFAGILATVLVQSSSVSTATIVGLVGAGTIGVPLAVPMIMGANIGTTVTNTLASLGSIRRSDDFRRAFAGATIHDFFNLLAVAILLPLELLTGVLSRSAAALTGVLRGSTVAEQGDSPLGAVVDLPVEFATSLLDGLSLGGTLAGIAYLALGLGAIFLALARITVTMRELVAGSVERAMNRVIGRGGGMVGMLVGLLVTVAVQSSSITTSILVPLVAAGILTLQNAYPITLGANIGTTITALLASLAVARPEGLTIALVHTLFNVIGIAIIYPFRPLRELPIRAAVALADVAVANRTYVVVYIVGVFLAVPLLGVLLIG